MTTVSVAIDHIRGSSQDLADLKKFCDALSNAGYTVNNVGRGPNRVQQHMLSHHSDIMIQVAGGLCVCTLGDFIAGIKRGYYHAKKGAIVFYMVANNLDARTWKSVRAHDWGGSTAVCNKLFGKTLPTIYSENSDVLTKFATGKTMDELIKSYLEGQSTSSESSEGKTQGSSILDLIKQVMSDNDHYGVDMDLKGDTMTIKKTQPDSGVPLGENRIINNSVSFTDYNPDTPNTFNSEKDQYLISRFGEVPLETDKQVAPIDEKQILQVSKRKHGHSIELKCLIGADYTVGKWVQLNLPSLGIENRPYYISKLSGDEDLVTSLTLEDAPPSIYVDVSEAAEEEEETEENSEDSESDSSEET